MGKWIKLPLYSDWDYKYSVVLEGQPVVLRMYYSERTEKWSIDLSLETGEDISLGEALSVFKKHLVRQGYGLTGYFWLEPIGQDDNQTPLHPDLLHKYYNFYYINEA